MKLLQFCVQENLLVKKVTKDDIASARSRRIISSKQASELINELNKADKIWRPAPDAEGRFEPFLW